MVSQGIKGRGVLSFTLNLRGLGELDLGRKLVQDLCLLPLGVGGYRQALNMLREQWKRVGEVKSGHLVRGVLEY